MVAEILVLGGTRFFGRQLVRNLIDDGHSVTIATRGQTRDNFGESVRRLVVDRGDADLLRSALGNAQFDVVYDQICYAPNDARIAVEVLEDRVNRYVFTSSMAVYEDRDAAWSEEGFNPYAYPVRRGERSDFDYAEGKRLAEAVLFQQASFDVTAVRFPVVLGVDDYSKRVEFHMQRMEQGIGIGFPNPAAKTCFINDKEAGNFLHWLVEGRVSGPINACSDGVISWREFFAALERRVGRTVITVPEAPDADISPYSERGSRFMHTRKATDAGFKFSSLNDWLPDVIEQIAF